jgi:hypothetical protein
MKAIRSIVYLWALDAAADGSAAISGGAVARALADTEFDGQPRAATRFPAGSATGEGRPPILLTK